MKKAILFSAVLAFTNKFAGCSSSSTLSSPKAKEIIESNKEFTRNFDRQKPRLLLTERQIQRGIERGYWTLHKDPTGGIYDYYVPTTKGQPYFDGVGRAPVGMVCDLKLPLAAHVLQVTGIRDNGPEAGKEKIVEYDWNWDFQSLPSNLQDLLRDNPPMHAKAVLDLYDDGWRAVHFSD